MGKRVLELAHQSPAFRLAGGCVSPSSPHLGIDLGVLIREKPIGIILTNDKSKAFADADVIIDFSTFGATRENLDAALKSGKPLVIGTTGHAPENLQAIESASKSIPILFASNFSIGMNACIEAVKAFAKALKGECDIDIVEIHHTGKKDAPSGSAKALAAATGYPDIRLRASPEEPRSKETVVIHSIRAGNTIGEHIVTFTCDDEKIELRHQAFSRDAFAKGALKAAQFLVGKPPGLYSFVDCISH